MPAKNWKEQAALGFYLRVTQWCSLEYTELPVHWVNPVHTICIFQQVIVMCIVEHAGSTISQTANLFSYRLIRIVSGRKQAAITASEGFHF